MQNVGQLSGDGNWRWDGTRWVPANQAPAAPGFYPSTPFVPGPTTNRLAMLSMSAGIAGWSFCPFLGAIVAVISGHMALRQLSRTPGQGGGEMAVIGLVAGYVHLVALAIGLFVWIVVLGGVAFLFTHGGHSG